MGLDQVCSRFLISQLVSETFLKLISCAKSRQILTFLPSQIFGCVPPKKLYISDHAYHMAKFRVFTPSTLKVIGADTLNLSQFLTTFEKKL